MSGLLQRLAARATGHAWTVRSDARLPFAAPVAMETPATSPQPARDARPDIAPARSARPPIPSTHGATEPTADVPLQPGSDADGASAAPATHVTPIEVPHLLQPQPAPFMPTPATRTASERVTPTTFAPQHPMPMAAAHATPVSATSVVRPRVRQVAADPPALMPARSTGTSQQRAQAMSTPAPRAPAAAPTMAAATEVHVHIGRIEVTALQAPAARQRPARERTQPVSLDAYLAKKKAT